MDSKKNFHVRFQERLQVEVTIGWKDGLASNIPTLLNFLVVASEVNEHFEF